MTSPSNRRAHVVGLGLIGASIARALSETGWVVTGTDADVDVLGAALDAGRRDGFRTSTTRSLSLSWRRRRASCPGSLAITSNAPRAANSS